MLDLLHRLSRALRRILKEVRVEKARAAKDAPGNPEEINVEDGNDLEGAGRGQHRISRHSSAGLLCSQSPKGVVVDL